MLIQAIIHESLHLTKEAIRKSELAGNEIMQDGSKRSVLMLAISIGNNKTQRELDFMMTDDDRLAYKALPDVVTVYRGCHSFNRDGLSWTTCKEVAEKITTMTRYGPKGHTSSVIKATIKKAGVVYKVDRNEFEMIVQRKLKLEVI